MQPTTASPAGWGGQPQWRVVETDFELGRSFLALWQAWRADPHRSALLHCTSFCAEAPDPSDLGGVGVATCEQLDALRRRWWGMVPGVHRLMFESGRVLLTLHVGHTPDAALFALREQEAWTDHVRLTGLHAQPITRELSKALAHCCRRGTTVDVPAGSTAWREALQQSGFVGDSSGAARSQLGPIRFVFAPRWTPRRPTRQQTAPSRALVVGAGLAGASAAASLARRGWAVEVLDQAVAPAAGASALPAGLMAPHTTPDDNLLSKLTRSGIRITLQQAAEHLVDGRDWAQTGVLERRVDGPPQLPAIGPGQEDWQCVAPGTSGALWHAAAAWIRPAALVHGWLNDPGIRFRGTADVRELMHRDGLWALYDAQGNELARAPLVVIAAAYGSASLANGRVQLNPVRGQVSWGRVHSELRLPATPVNGNGHFLPAIPSREGHMWLTGSTYVRGDTSVELRSAENAANLERVRTLLPECAAELAKKFESGEVDAWAGVRCTAADRRPIVGELEPGLWLSTAMGSRGLTFAALCGELLAARLHNEPLPVSARLARALSLERLRGGPPPR